MQYLLGVLVVFLLCFWDVDVSLIMTCTKGVWQFQMHCIANIEEGVSALPLYAQLFLQTAAVMFAQSQ